MPRYTEAAEQEREAERQMDAWLDLLDAWAEDEWTRNGDRALDELAAAGYYDEERWG